MSQNLFSSLVDPKENLLPQDGIVNYHGPVLREEAADHYFRRLMDGIAWRHDVNIMFGKRITTRRKVAWYADQPLEYTYSSVTKSALPWTDDLRELKTIVEDAACETFNSCLLNLYHSGEEGMSWHSDAEAALEKHGAIGSLSLGAERRFAFKHKVSKRTVSVELEHGSLLVMKGATQAHWKHSLPPTKKITSPRINLTFRTIVPSAR